ncbi:uncharacterized protein A4U43_C03F18210 [Asparagus officinalis]|uniref:Uncharacterized protein n=1 Tax=Asparagus officinalis TaxID=4686 RepID=A0A5P1FC03_ASPOF|nr:uncharacterized protein A4U43_C03F18210 [Asparagus officinalis]
MRCVLTGDGNVSRRKLFSARGGMLEEERRRLRVCDSEELEKECRLIGDEELLAVLEPSVLLEWLQQFCAFSFSAVASCRSISIRIRKLQFQLYTDEKRIKQVMREEALHVCRMEAWGLWFGILLLFGDQVQGMLGL